MKRFLIAATIAAAAMFSAPASAQVSISVGQPGFYGRLDIGGFPPPPLLFPEPIMIQRVPVSRPPLYLRVPPGHARDWRKHCHRYRACGERVYFVQDDWYRHEYAPRYRERYEHRHDYREHRRDERHDYRVERRDDRRDYREERRDDRRDYRHDRHDDRGRDRDDDRGHGRGRDH